MTENISSIISEALSKKYDISDVSISWEVPQDPSHGDRATPLSLQIAKRVGSSPRDIAEYIVSSIENHEDISRVEIAGPGYINIWFTANVLLGGLSKTFSSCSAKPTRKDEDPVIVEYSQPNIAKPLGVHHLLSTVVGQSIANLYKHDGYNVVTWNYMGDWGTQFGKLAVAVERWGDKQLTSEYTIDELLQLYIKFHSEAESDESLIDQGREAFAKLENGDVLLKQFWNDVVAITKSSLLATYEKLDVHFDTDISESFFEGKMLPILEEGKKKGVFTEGEKGALIAQFPEETNLQPAIVLKADGATIYHTRDLALARYTIDEFHPKAVYHVVDTAQENYFQQLFGIIDQLGWNLEVHHTVVGRMSFADRSMSTRKGNILSLQEFLDEAVLEAKKAIKEHGDSIQTNDPELLAEVMGIGSVSYGILSQNRRLNMIFDWQKFLSFDGNSAPYIQYTYARTYSILEKAGSPEPSFVLNIDVLEAKERSLLNVLLRFSDILDEARDNQMPHILCNYIYNLCQEFNAFYSAHPILTASGVQKDLRILLTNITAHVLKTSAHLLTMRVPERM